MKLFKKNLDKQLLSIVFIIFIVILTSLYFLLPKLLLPIYEKNIYEYLKQPLAFISDDTLENKIEDNILGDIPWNKTEETYLLDEDVWQVSYFFEI